MYKEIFRKGNTTGNMRIGATEIIVVLIVALLVIGPDKLPAYAKKFGEALAVFKKATSEATKDIQESVVEPLNEAQKPLRDAVEPLEETRKEIHGQVEGLQKSLNNIGKPVKSGAAKKAVSEKQEGAGADSEKQVTAGTDSSREDETGTENQSAETVQTVSVAQAPGTMQSVPDQTESVKVLQNEANNGDAAAETILNDDRKDVPAIKPENIEEAVTA